MNSENPIKYFAYVRKSTEGDERQALSIESQMDKVREFFSGLEIVEVMEEKHSAFSPYNRPVFAEMIKRIRKGEAQGIIAWHPDRLSRNEIDASTITYLVRTGIIKDLKFGSYNFDNSPEGIMMLQLALSQSQYFSSKLGKDVKRGLEKKVSLGWLPGVAPEGYLNDMRLEKGQRTLIIDKKRAPLLKEAFKLFLTGNYTAQEVLDKLNNEWKYTTRAKAKTGGKPLARSTWYKMLTSSFYAGIITYNGKESPGKHKPIISLEDYNRIQELLGLRGNKRNVKKLDFMYSGTFTCGFCGCAITAERKRKYIKEDNEVKTYRYYHCTHKKKEIACKEGSIQEEELEKQVKNDLKKLEMHPQFLSLALDYLEKNKTEEDKTEKPAKLDIEKQIKDLEDQLSELNSMRMKKMLDDTDYLTERTKLKAEIEALSLNEVKTKPSKAELIELTKVNFIFCAQARKEFDKGDKETRNNIIKKLGSNQAIIGKNISISYHNWLIPLRNSVEKFNAEMTRFEPIYFGENKRKNEALTSLNLRWLGDMDSNHDRRLQRPLSYH